jgi:hypothetical protein
MTRQLEVAQGEETTTKQETRRKGKKKEAKWKRKEKRE